MTDFWFDRLGQRFGVGDTVVVGFPRSEATMAIAEVVSIVDTDEDDEPMVAWWAGRRIHSAAVVVRVIAWCGTDHKIGVTRSVPAAAVLKLGMDVAEVTGLAASAPSPDEVAEAVAAATHQEDAA